MIVTKTEKNFIDCMLHIISNRKDNCLMHENFDAWKLKELHVLYKKAIFFLTFIIIS